MSPLAKSLFRRAIIDHLLAEIYRISEQDQKIQQDVHLTICKLNQYLLKQGSMISIQDLRDLESKNFQVAQNFMRIARSLQPLVSDKDRKASHKEEDRKATYKKTAHFAESMLELMSKKETRGEALASSKPKRARLDELEEQMSHFDALILIDNITSEHDVERLARLPFKFGLDFDFCVFVCKKLREKNFLHLSAAKNFFRFPRGQAFYVCLTEPLRIGEMVEFLKNREFLDALIEFDWRYVCYLDKTFKNDKTLVLAILSKLKSLEEARALLNFLADEPALYEIISVIKVKFRVSSYKQLFEDYEKDRENNLPYLKALLGSFDAAFEAIKLSSENLKYIPDSLRIQKEFILQAIQINPQVFEIAQESLKKEEDFVFEAIARNLQVINFVDPVMLAAQPLIVRIVQSYGDLLDQDEFIKLVEQRTGLLANKVEISLFLRALIIVHQNPMDFKRLDVSLKQNPQLLHFFLEHPRFNLDDLDHQGVCSEYIKNWIRIFKDPMAIFQIKIDDIDHKLFLHALNSFCDQRRNLEGFEQGLESFKELKKNPRLPPMIYFLAITGNQTAKGASLQIEDLHAQYPSDRDVVYPILKRDLSQFCKLSSSLKSDRQFVLKLLKGQGRLTQDSDLIMKEVPHFRNDLLFMIEATKIYPFCVHYISDKLVERLDFIDLAIARGAYGVLAHKKFSKNKRLFLEIMKKNPEVAQYAHVDLQSDPEFSSKMKRLLEERVASEGFPPL